MTSGATKIQKSTFSKHDDTMTIWEFESVYLWFDLDSLNSWISFKSSHVNLIIEMTNVTDDGIVLHLGHVGSHNNSLVSGTCDVDISCSKNAIESLDLETFHACLKSTDWINLNYNNSGTTVLHGLGTSLTDITVSENNSLFTSNHNISGSHKTIWK